MQTNTHLNNRRILWLTDLHLDRADLINKRLLYDGLAGIEYDIAVITGDISTSSQLQTHLLEIAHACYPRPVYFVLGNHDYYGSGLAEVDQGVEQICQQTENLHVMDGSQVIDLGCGVGLIGHRGWADARAGNGESTRVQNPDRNHIKDFEGLNTNEMIRKMRLLGDESARCMRRTLRSALCRFPHVVILTHVPPLDGVVMYNSKPCDLERIPHFANLSLGFAIRGITRSYPHRKVTVLCGHSHSGHVCDILYNLTMRVGEARTGKPDIQDVLIF